MRHRASPEFIRPRNCVPMTFTTENPPAQSQRSSSSILLCYYSSSCRRVVGVWSSMLLLAWAPSSASLGVRPPVSPHHCWGCVTTPLKAVAGASRATTTALLLTAACCSKRRRRTAGSRATEKRMLSSITDYSASGGGLSREPPSTHQLLLPLFFNDVYRVELPAEHRFPMEKYRLVRKSENRAVGFPWSEASVKRTTSSVGGTVAAMHSVCRGMRDGLSGEGSAARPMFAGHIAGGTHHAFRDRGEGFCVFSDIAVAANVALRDYPDIIRQILIVDCDVHQGNGNAVLFASNSRVFTFSMHCKANYFSEKQASDFDVEVKEGASDEEYLNLLRWYLPRLVDGLRPDLIFYQGGVDPLVHDRLGKLSLSREGLRHRNRIVYGIALDRCIPVVITMGGGYPTELDPSSTSFRHIVRSHQDVYADAAEYL